MLMRILIIFTGAAALMLASTPGDARDYWAVESCRDYALHASERSADGNDAVDHVLTGAYLGGVYDAVTRRAHSHSQVGERVYARNYFTQGVYDDAYLNCSKQSKFHGNSRPKPCSRTRQ